MFIIQWLFENEKKPIRKSITENADLDRYIFDKLTDKELIKSWNLNRRIYFQIVNDSYIRRRLSKYKDIEKYKKENESWKRFYVRATRYISTLNNKCHFNYTEGDFEKYFNILRINILQKPYKDFMNVATSACNDDDLPLFLYGMQGGNFTDSDWLRYSIIKNSMKIVKYLLEKGGKIPDFRKSEILEDVTRKGYFGMLKFLVEEQNFNIHDLNEYVFRIAAANGNLDIVKYTVEKGADINIKNSEALIFAAAHNHFDVVKYLVEQGSIITPKVYEFLVKFYHKDISNFLYSKRFEYKKLEV